MSIYNDLLLSLDVETTGPVPGCHSMLSLATVPIINGVLSKNIFYKKLKRLPGATWDDSTKEFWKKYPEQLKEAIADAEDPEVVMEQFLKYVASFGYVGGRIVFVADPAVFDGAWLQYYVHKFLGHSANAFLKRIRIIDMRSMMMSMINTPYSETHPQNMNVTDLVITHVASEDALCQAEIFMALVGASAELAAIKC